MIVRMWEGRIVDGRLDEYLAVLREHVWPSLSGNDSFAGGEVFRSYDDEPRLVVLTRWRDEAGLSGCAGPMWRDTPVVLPQEEELLARPPQVWHFSPVDME